MGRFYANLLIKYLMERFYAKVMSVKGITELLYACHIMGRFYANELINLFKIFVIM